MTKYLAVFLVFSSFLSSNVLAIEIKLVDDKVVFYKKIEKKKNSERVALEDSSDFEDFYENASHKNSIKFVEQHTFNPTLLLERNVKTYEKYQKEIAAVQLGYFSEVYNNNYDDITLNIKYTHARWQMTKFFEVETLKNPIWLLRDCKNCYVKRSWDSKPKDDFEDHAIQLVLKHAYANGGAVNVASYGTDGLFLEFSILSQLLAKTRFIEEINLSLIGFNYEDMIRSLDREFSDEIIYTQYEQYENRFFQIESIKQLYSWFRVVHPNVKLNIYLFSSLTGFTDHTRRFPEHLADVYYSADTPEVKGHDQFIHQYLNGPFEQILKPEGEGFLLVPQDAYVLKAKFVVVSSPYFFIKTLPENAVREVGFVEYLKSKWPWEIEDRVYNTYYNQNKDGNFRIQLTVPTAEVITKRFNDFSSKIGNLALPVAVGVCTGIGSIVYYQCMKER